MLTLLDIGSTQVHGFFSQPKHPCGSFGITNTLASNSDAILVFGASSLTMHTLSLCVVFLFARTRIRISSRTRASLLCYSSYTLLIRTKHSTVPGHVTSWFFHSVVVPARSILNSTLCSNGRKLSSSTNKRKNNKIFFPFLFLPCLVTWL